MNNSLLSFAGWYFLPNLVSGYLQSILYTVCICAGDPKPTPGTPRFNRDRRLIRIFVTLIYLLYTVYEADYELRKTGDFYQALGVPHDVDDKGLQSKFRRLTVQFHPDKATGTDKIQIEHYYNHIKLARDTLIDPAKRFAYDRFGAEVLQWRHCKTMRDFVFHGAQQTAIYYFASGCGLILVSVLGYLREGKFWRYLFMAGMFVLEVWCMTRPMFPPVLTKFVNPVLVRTGLREPYLPFQMLSLLRKLGITFFIALNQLTPLFQDPQEIQKTEEIGPKQLDRLDNLAKATEQEVSRLMGLELSPFAHEKASLRELRSSLREWLVQNTVRSDPQVKAAMNTGLQRRRELQGDVGPPVPPHLS